MRDKIRLKLSMDFQRSTIFLSYIQPAKCHLNRSRSSAFQTRVLCAALPLKISADRPIRDRSCLSSHALIPLTSKPAALTGCQILPAMTYQTSPMLIRLYSHREYSILPVPTSYGYDREFER